MMRNHFLQLLAFLKYRTFNYAWYLSEFIFFFIPLVIKFNYFEVQRDPIFLEKMICVKTAISRSLVSCVLRIQNFCIPGDTCQQSPIALCASGKTPHPFLTATLKFFPLISVNRGLINHSLYHVYVSLL